MTDRRGVMGQKVPGGGFHESDSAAATSTAPPGQGLADVGRTAR
jgi:hypothetical protein